VLHRKHYKILYVSEGYNVYDRRFLEKMIERGHEPIFVSYLQGEIVSVKGVKTIHKPFAFWMRFGRLGGPLHFPQFRRALIVQHLCEVIRKGRPDVLHTGYIREHGYYGALTGFHPVLSMPWGSDVLVRPDKTVWDAKIVRFTLQKADMITCDCELVKNRIIELTGCLPNKIVVFPWGVDLTNYRPIKGPSVIRERLGWQEKSVLIMNRQFEPIYGIEYFLDALPIIIRACAEVKVLLIGKGSLEDKLKSMVKELGVADYVYFAGTVDDQDMAQCLNAADIYVTTSLSDGTSACMMEAMACELPVIVSDAPAYFEWVEDGINGYIVPRRNFTVLAERLIELLQNPMKRKKMGQHNLQIARERADWERNFDVLEGIYEVLVRDRAKRAL
jgi:glycosyltransferase involved in cell wall biosynthesis